MWKWGDETVVHKRETAWLPLRRLLLWLPVYHNELRSRKCRRTLFIFICSWSRHMDRPVLQAARWLQACYHACTPVMETILVLLFMYLLAAWRCQSAWLNVSQIHGIHFTSPPRKDRSIILSHSIWTNQNFSQTVEIVGMNASLLVVLIETTVSVYHRPVAIC